MIKRYTINGVTEANTTTLIEVDKPTLLQPTREDFSSTSGVGEIRIGVQMVDHSIYTPNPLYPTAWVNGDIWLPKAGLWNITIRGYSELVSGAGTVFALPYLGISNPDQHTLDVASSGLSSGHSAYHAENVTQVWNQIQKLEQRLIVSQFMTLSARGGDLRYRWGGPAGPGILSDGIAWDLLHDGDVVWLGPCPLASLWVRADQPNETVTINLNPRRIR